MRPASNGEIPTFTGLELAAQKGPRFVDLTSRPSRDVANNLYQPLGFKLRETNCYRHNLDSLGYDK